MVSKLYETKYKPGKWKFTFKWLSKRKPLKRRMTVRAIQYMRKKGKDTYTGQIKGRRY